MSTQVDDLQIKLSAEADKANKAIDLLISKLGTLEGKISSFGKIGNVDKNLSKNVGNAVSGTADKIKKEMENASASVSKQTQKMSKDVGTHIAELRSKFGDLGKSFESMGGFANLKTSDQMERAIDNYRVKIAKAYESAAKSGYGTKGFDSAIKSVIEYTNILDALQRKLDAFNQAANAPATPKINIQDFTSGANTVEKTVQDVLASLHSLYNTDFADSPSSLRALRNEFTSLREEITQNADMFKTALGDDPSLLNAIDRALENINSRMATMTNQTKSAEKVMEEMPRSADETSRKYSMVGATVDAFMQKVSNLPKFLEKINVIKPTQSFLDLQDQIDKADAKLLKLIQDMSRGLATNPKFTTTTTYAKMQYDIERTRESMRDLEREMDDLGNRTHELNFEGFGDVLKSSFSTTLSIVGKIGSAFSSIAKTVSGKVVSGVKSFAKNLNKTDDIAKKLFKSFTRVGNMLRLMITRMALRAVITETRTSFGELLQFSDKTAASFNKIRNAIKYLADTIVTLTAPILNASGTFRGLGNIIDMVSDKIVDLINKFNQLLSAILGHSTWIKATKQTKDYTKEVDKAGKAAKKALQPFDELNNLTSNDSGTNPDGGTGGSQFNELPIDPKWLKIADWLKDMWKKADFSELGALLGAKLRDALNSIPWGKIQNTARRIASSIATLLNGFFRTPGLAKSIGNTIAGAINTGLIFAEEFIKKFDFGAFGKFIGDAIVSAIKGIQWQRFIDACKNLGKGIATAINSLANTGVISEIGKAIGKILLGAINFAFNLVTSIKFDKLAEEIANGIKNVLNALGDVDKETKLTGWEKIGKTLSDGILGILKILNKTLGDKEIRDKIGKGITELLNQIRFSEIISQSAELVGNIAKGFASVMIAVFKSEEFRKGVAAAIPYLAGAFTLSLAGKGLASAAVAIGKNLLRNLGLYIVSGEAFAKFMNIGAKLFEGVGAGAVSVVGKVGTAITTALSGIGGTITVACSTLAAGVVAFFAGADIGNTIGKYLYPDDKELYEKYDGIKGTINLTIEAIVTFYQRAYERISGWIKNWVDYQKNSVNTAVSFVKQKFGEAKAFVVGKFTEIKTNITNIINTIVTVIQTTINNAISFVRTAGQNVYTAVTGIFTSIGQFFATLPQKAMTWGSNFISGLISGMQQKIGAVGGIISTVVSHFRQNADGGIFINGKWKPIQGYASGGQPKSAEMFLARENGAPELVGKMGSHTAVANNDQIVASVSDGVYRAVMAAMANQGGNINVSVELVGDTAKLFRAIRKEGNDYQKRTGNPVFA